MSYLMDVPNAPRAGENWQAYFDYTFVDAKKPLFFGEGTVMRQVNKTTGQLRLDFEVVFLIILL
jgi:5'-nucleotidase